MVDKSMAIRHGINSRHCCTTEIFIGLLHTIAYVPPLRVQAYQVTLRSLDLLDIVKGGPWNGIQLHPENENVYSSP